MRRFTIFSCSVPTVLALAFMTGCAARVNKPVVTPTGTLAELRNVSPDVKEVRVEQGLEQAMQNYRRFLEDTPKTETAMTPEAIRRLADLQLEKQFGIHPGDAKLKDAERKRDSAQQKDMAAPQPAQLIAGATERKLDSVQPGTKESDQDFERRA